jgi:hypothetical protein
MKFSTKINKFKIQQKQQNFNKKYINLVQTRQIRIRKYQIDL